MNGVIKGHFGKHMPLETKLQIYNITSEVALCYGSENWTINKRDAKKLEVAQMRLLRPLLGLRRLDSQRNPDICNRLKVNNLIEDIKLYQKSWLDHLERNKLITGAREQTTKKAQPSHCCLRTDPVENSLLIVA
jgi:hypothetical protein